jgi:hypothetical protein
MNHYSAKKGAFKGDFNVKVPTNDSCSLSPWEKSNSRKRLISDLKNYRSTIKEINLSMFKTLLAEACLRESKPTCCSPTESMVDGVMACCDKSFCSEVFSHVGGAGIFSVFVALSLLMNCWAFLSSSPLRR